MESSLRKRKRNIVLTLLLVTVVCTVLSIVLITTSSHMLENTESFSEVEYILLHMFGFVFLVAAITLLVFLICSFFIKVRTTNYQDNIIIIYSGLFSNRLYVNDILNDVQTSSFYVKPLHGNLPSGEQLEVTISGMFTTSIILKINGQVISSI